MGGRINVLHALDLDTAVVDVVSIDANSVHSKDCLVGPGGKGLETGHQICRGPERLPQKYDGLCYGGISPHVVQRIEANLSEWCLV